jgi:SAM-dependent methyltransferase
VAAPAHDATHKRGINTTALDATPTSSLVHPKDGPISVALIDQIGQDFCSMMPNRYGPLATEIYDRAYPIGTSFGDVEYYRSALGGTLGRVMEPAAGSGRILIPLTEAGYDVDGFDTSPEMLALARSYCQQRSLSPTLELASMTDVVKPAGYEAVIVPTGSIVLLDKSGAAAAIDAFYGNLRPGGRLILDVPAPRMISEPETLRTWHKDTLAWTIQTMTSVFDRVTEQITHWLRYEKWDDGVLVSSELMLFRIQHWGLEAFSDLLLTAGFTDIEVAADYDDGESPASESDNWTFTVRKPA